MYRHNGGYKGLKNAVGGVRSATSARGYANGGYIGDLRRTDSADLSANVGKVSGIWKLSGTKFVEQYEVTTEQDNSYYCQPPQETAFCQTGCTYLGGGYTWNVAAVVNACPGYVTWPQGDYGGHSSSGYAYLSRKWTDTTYDPATCDGWTFDVYGVSGYDYNYYPPPVYVEQIDIIYNYYDIWDYFS